MQYIFREEKKKCKANIRKYCSIHRNQFAKLIWFCTQSIEYAMSIAMILIDYPHA